MTAKQDIFRIRRNYNQWVNNQTLEDYALRFTAKSARRWPLLRVANTALGAISFLALEAIGGTITLNYGFSNAATAILLVGLIILLAGIPICYYAARDGVDIDLLTRGAGFGYIGSTATSLIYASFTFIFFALEAAILAVVLQLWFGLPLAMGYIVCSLVVIPIVTHGITWISRFQLWTQPLWVVLQLLPFVFLLGHEFELVRAWVSFDGLHNATPDIDVSLIYFGAAAAVLFSLIAQIGEQVDYLRFLPEKTADNRVRWWVAVLTAGPGWIVLGVIKVFAGSLLAYLAFSQGVSADKAADPARMYMLAFSYVVQQPEAALALAGIFVIVSQLKINVTNAYAGSIAWSNFFSRLTHSHPGRVVWLVFNVAIALLLMELGVYHAFEKTLGVYAIVAVAWVGALVSDLVVNKPLGLSPPKIEFRRAYLHDINPVGVGSMVTASVVGIFLYLGMLGDIARALAHFITLATAFALAPAIAWLTRGRFYIAREPHIFAVDEAESGTCCICQNHYEVEDMAHCPAYAGPICSLCCSLDSRCQDSCKPVKKIPEMAIDLLAHILPKSVAEHLNSRLVHFAALLMVVAAITGVLLSLIYTNSLTPLPATNALLSAMLWKVFFILLIIAGVVAWLFVLAHESRLVAQEESQRQNRLLQEEITAHEETDRKLQQAKEKAEAANSAKSRYLTGISHELRSPLNSILGYAQLLEHDEEISENKRYQLSVIRNSGEHLSDLIEGLLDISKIESGRLDIHRDQVRISALLDQLVYMFRLQAEEKGLRFEYQCHSVLAEYVTTDEKRLRQILINLLSNAVKFTERGGVSFSVRYRSQVAEFSIKDTGVGIPEDELERIFRPFERVRTPGSPQVSGTGLGLTITRLLVDIMGGDLEVVNNPEGGCTFTVWMMLSQVVTPVSVQPSSQRVYGYEGARRTVMVVDDDPSHRGLISDMLGPLGFYVLEAQSAAACLHACDELVPDLFLLDISMPERDGIQLASDLRERGYDTPIMMLSAVIREDNQQHTMANLLEHPYDDFLVKPVKLQRLLEKLRFHLDLEWQYQPLANTQRSSELFTQRQFTVADMPPQATIEELCQLAEIGHLSGLKQKISEIEEGQLAGEAFVQQIKQLIFRVQFSVIIELLRDAGKHNAVREANG
ncbi:ATP-binding protein [Teredinibacter turnerae]|uniref:ATP-binding protein n=1 Tax=Teredinibacter turnerae TaxID=2426 RepID=UPI000365A3BE|nr:ATP-binding protein [Teredinibacter turnerae]